MLDHVIRLLIISSFVVVIMILYYAYELSVEWLSRKCLDDLEDQDA